MSNFFAQYGIEIDSSSLQKQGTSQTYEAEIKLQLHRIAGSDTGKALLRAIKTTVGQAHKSLGVAIQPTSDMCNASTGTRDARKATPHDEYFLQEAGHGPAGVAYRPTAKRPAILGIPIPFSTAKPIVGTGEGASAVVFYDPSRLGTAGNCGAYDPPGAFTRRADVVLLHELLHAYRAVRGNYWQGQVYGARKRYHNEEEFFAILVGNIYASDATSTIPKPAPLRADHEDYSPLDPQLASTEAFYADLGNRRLISKFVSQEPGLCLELATVSAGFNPIRLHVDEWRGLSNRVKCLR